jgi:hypothetical protein
MISLTQVVGGVVNAVEDAAGQQGSETGNAIEQQAANVENALNEAAARTAAAANDAAGSLRVLVGAGKDEMADFTLLVGTHIRDGIASWLFGGSGSSGTPLPDQMRRRDIVGLARDVGSLTGRKIKAKATERFGTRVVGAAEQGVGYAGDVVTGGPIAAWRHIVAALGGANDDVMGRLRHSGSRAGVAMAKAPPAKVIGDTLRHTPERPGAFWRAIKAVLNDARSTGSGGLERLAQRAGDEHRKLLAALRNAVQAAGTSPAPAGLPAPGPTPALHRAFSDTIEGQELRLLIATLLVRTRNGAVRPNAKVLRHLTDAAAAAARAAVLDAELLNWLETLHHATRSHRGSMKGPVLGPTRG